ncbi:MAG TPA: putative DNA-binding protein [Firmicutes bacterium]|nr:putative DNA-binding protein [Bacillota bacterium]
MEHLVRMGLLFDFYGELLTSKQKRVFSLYYMHNLSLAEIAEEEGTTRQAVHDLLQRTEKLLENWEEKLLLLNRFLQGQNLLQAVLNSFAKLAEAIPEQQRATKQYREFTENLKELETFLSI